MANSDHRKYIALTLLILYIIAMMIGFLITVPKSLDSLEKNDKLVHFTEFFILSILALWTFKLFKFKNYYILGIVLSVIFVILSESLQSLIPTRDFSYYDMLADAAGIIVGTGVFKWIFSRRSS